MADNTSSPAHGIQPPHNYVENEGYIADGQTQKKYMPGSALDDPEQSTQQEDDDDYDDLFNSEDDFSDTDLQSANPADYTKAYNRQRRVHDPAVPSDQKPKTNPQLNTRAAIDDHIQTLSRHTSKLRLSAVEAGLGGGSKAHHGAEKSDRATTEQVLDPRTKMILLQLLNRNIVSEINGVISTGKEANVYHAVTYPPTEDGDAPSKPLHRAIKVYKTSILVFKDRDKYVTGEFRFKGGYNKSSNKAMVKVWAEKEFRNLRRLWNAGIPCPEPVHLKAHVLVMGFIGNGRGWPAPRLRDFEFTLPAPNNDQSTDVSPTDPSASDTITANWRTLYLTLLRHMRTLHHTCRLVHADLSEYNLLYHNASTLYFIDVSQSVEPSHPRALDFLRMDIKNISDFFRRKDVETLSERAVFGFITASAGPMDEAGMTEGLERLHEVREEGDGEDEGDEEVWRQMYLPQTLRGVYDIERDAETLRRGEGEGLVYRDLLADPSKQEVEAAKEGDDEAQGSASSASEDDTNDTDDNDGSETGDFKHRDDEKPRGKRFEDKDAKKAHKSQVKEEKREARRNKMPKHVKKGLVGKSARGKK
ncbi:hypothetical protein B0A50_07876 [Salinomyces thailandicus]|uniref:Serine/threonine-protein kinase RIO1 n=1 Tax=Salinomyces thailandicus TaxID=706561 RepID=A0A4U0TLJ8_9PEZI|nr:hypothetical protein B0A50_07876 [Salinomyces thailandica]